jgi:peroxiredoxin Q/BCP
VIRVFSFLLLTMGWLFGTQAEDGIKIGDPLPALTVPDQDGKPFDLGSYGSKGLLLVFFYPKANTPGCTAQACSLRDANAELTQKGVKVVGVSADKPDSQKEFVTRQKLPYPLLADHEGKVIKAFGVEGMAFGFAKRSAFLFQDGKLVWRDPKGSTSDQGETVLKAIESLPRP